MCKKIISKKNLPSTQKHDTWDHQLDNDHDTPSSQFLPNGDFLPSHHRRLHPKQEHNLQDAERFGNLLPRQ
ncbi:unnamed protein product [Pseudo-nitzschia multistriata]|uniref:Uncharacterized protein n=1 Tax=Pseudo-nitzschia multistriata TaxID=183589 RepID=A0A448ZEW5_9STRA|nr:unnamed protein product [Pseudo-nitzschia multistriata]